MPQTVGFAIAALVGASVTASTAATIGTIALGLASSLASTAISMVMAGQQQGIKPSDGQQEVKQPLAERTKSYGKVRKSGTMFWLGTDPAGPKELYIGMALNHGRIAGIDEYMIDDTIVTLHGNGDVVEDPYNDELANITVRLGLPTETAYSDLSSKFGMSAVRGDGVASLLGKFGNSTDANAQMQTYPQGVPQLRVTMRASVCFDPREPAHNVNDPSTWTWSENAAVVILNYMIDPDGFGMSYDRIAPNLAEWIAAMDICDEDVALVAGGTEKRYRAAGTYSFTERPRDVLVRMLACCDGRVWQRRDGSIGFKVGRFTAPTVTIESRDILSYNVRHGQDPLTAVAGLRAQFMSPAHDYREHEAEPWPSGEAIVGLDEDRIDTLDLLWSPSQSQTRRIMKREYVRRTTPWTIQISTNLAGLRALDEQYINLEIDELGIADTFEVQRFTLDPSTLTCQLDVVAIGATIDDWNAGLEEGDAPPATMEYRTTTSAANQSATSVAIAGCDIGAAAADRDVIASVTMLVGTNNRTISSATIGGVAARVSAQKIFQYGPGYYLAAILSAPLPTGTTADINLTMSGSVSTQWMRAATYRATGLQSNTEVGWAISDDNNSGVTSRTLNVYVPAGGLGFLVGFPIGDNSNYTLTGCSEDFDTEMSATLRQVGGSLVAPVESEIVALNVTAGNSFSPPWVAASFR